MTDVVIVEDAEGNKFALEVDVGGDAETLKEKYKELAVEHRELQWDYSDLLDERSSLRKEYMKREGIHIGMILLLLCFIACLFLFPEAIPAILNHNHET